MAVLTVGSNETYKTLSAALAASHDGDNIRVDAGTYTNDFAEVTTKVTIEGVGGVANFVATQQPPNGKAILTTDTDVTINNLSFSGATVPDNNGAGIRYQGGNLVLNNDTFTNNQDGILGGPATAGTGSITINGSTFDHNGAGDGYSHNLYVGEVNKLTISNSTFTNAVLGHEIKSRADNTVIQNNLIADGPTGTASYSIDLPDGGNAQITGNTIEKGPNASNPNLIHFGGDGTQYTNDSLTVSGNTLLNDNSSASPLYNQTGTAANFTGNGFYNLAQNATGPANFSGNTVLSTEPSLTVPGSSSNSGGSASGSSGNNSGGTSGGTSSGNGGTASGGTASPDTVTLSLSEDAWQGDAQFVATIDGKPLGGTQTVTASHGAGQTQTFNYTGNFGSGPHTVGVQFLNDAWGGTPQTDRNLYIDQVSYDGTASPAGATEQATNGTSYFPVNGATSDTITLDLSEEAWQGDAQFVATIDGNTLGAPTSVTALHDSGQTQAFTYTGNWGPGPHTIGVQFLNDAWGGTPQTDRNLFVDTVKYDGQTTTPASAGLYTNSTATFSVAGAAAAAVANTQQQALLPTQ